MSEDIGLLLVGWDYVPGEITARKIVGDDGKEKLQLRLDMGLLQMEMQGRPDGQRPYGKESLLHHFLAELDRYKAKHIGDEGYQLSSEDARFLREEATQYYYRYLSLYQLGDYEQVEKDTARNLRVFDLIKKYAAEESDRLSLELYRPYVIMMNTKAKAQRLLQAHDHKRALTVVENGAARVESFYQSFDHAGLVGASGEIASLKRLAEHIREEMPRTRKEILQEQLQQAIRGEEYEKAARLRDELRSLQEMKPT